MTQKRIAADDQSRWEDTILRDLSYIKQNKRYRWNAKLRAPLIIYSILFILIALLFATSIPELKSEPRYRMMSHMFIPVLTIIFFGISIYKYLLGLRFINLSTGLSKQRNHDLLVAFLNQKSLMVYYHPLSKDVLQIISRPISQENQQREVLVFILDENNILINSHFTEQGWRINPSSRHDKQMGGELEQFIASNKNKNERAIGFNQY